MARVPRSVLVTLLAIDVILIAAGGISEYLGHPSFLIESRFGLDKEAAVPAWYSSVKLLIVGLALWALSVALGTAGRPRRILQLAALMFLAMSCDEAAGLHEAVDMALREHLLSPEQMASARELHLSLGGVIVGLIGLFVAALVIRAALGALRDCRTGAPAFLFGFLVLVAGAVVVDLAHGLLPLAGAAHGATVAIEEGLEMVGVSLMIYGALSALAALSSWEIDRSGLHFKAPPPLAASAELPPPRLAA